MSEPGRQSRSRAPTVQNPSLYVLYGGTSQVSGSLLGVHMRRMPSQTVRAYIRLAEITTDFDSLEEVAFQAVTDVRLSVRDRDEVMDFLEHCENVLRPIERPLGELHEPCKVPGFGSHRSKRATAS